MLADACVLWRDVIANFMHWRSLGVSTLLIRVNQNQLGRKGLISASMPQPQSVMKGSQGRNWKHSLKQRPWWTATYWLFLMDCSTCFLTPARTPCPGEDAFTVKWVSPSQASISETPYRLLPRQSCEGVFSNTIPSSQMILACVNLT